MHGVAVRVSRHFWSVFPCVYTRAPPAGLAYTTFSYGVAEGPREVSSAPVSAYLARHPNHGSRFASLLDNPIVAEYNVSVTNTGDVDSGA